MYLLTIFVQRCLLCLRYLFCLLSANQKKLKRLLQLYHKDFPHENEVKGAIAAIFRLQDLYKISAQTFADGLGPRAHRLILEEVFELGFIALGKNNYHLLSSTLNQNQVNTARKGFCRCFGIFLQLNELIVKFTDNHTKPFLSKHSDRSLCFKICMILISLENRGSAIFDKPLFRFSCAVP